MITINGLINFPASGGRHQKLTPGRVGLGWAQVKAPTNMSGRNRGNMLAIHIGPSMSDIESPCRQSASI
jgi:hypothetical protein